MLGRGLESLIPDKSKRELGIGNKELGTTDNKILRVAQNDKVTDEAIFQIEVEKIGVNPFQPRKSFDPVALQELASSIREYGILQPLIVTKQVQETDRGTDVTYELVAGERRLQAARVLGLQRVPVIIRAIPNQRERLEVALIENIQRENLSSMETARAYAQLQDSFGLTQREIAAKVGKSRETVANALRLLNLPTHIQEALTGGKISESQARMLLAVSDIAHQEELFADICNNNLSVRGLKARIARVNRKPRGVVAELAAATTIIAPVASSQQPVATIDPEIAGIQDALEEALGVAVEVERDSQRNTIKITFSSEEDLQELVKKLTGE